MACDSAYCAYLKAYYPYEFYTTALKLYTEKGNKEKIALLIDEMRRYAGISLSAGCFGNDNTDWLCDKANHTISQSLSSVKFISKQAAEDLKEASGQHFDCFVDLLFWLMENSCLDSRQMQVLISINYFKPFGDPNKLMKLYDEFKNGKNRISKTLKSKEARLASLRQLESELSCPPQPICERVKAEHEYIGLCLSMDENAKGRYLLCEIDDKYGIKLKLYNIFRGRYTSQIRMKKDVYACLKPHEGDIIYIASPDWCKVMPKRVFKNGKSELSPTEKETWLTKYVLKEAA